MFQAIDIRFAYLVAMLYCKYKLLFLDSICLFSIDDTMIFP